MKYMIGTTALFLILFSTPAFAQEEPKPQQQEEHKPQDSKAPVPEKAPPEKPDAAQPKEKQPPPEKSQPKPQADQKQQQQEQKAQEKQTQEQQKQAQKQAQQQQKQQQAQSHNAAAQNGGNARRIPDDKFRAHFGPQHHFRPARGNNGRFQYGGYWFVYTDPWPVGWSYDDDCYIEDDDGVYYLVDVLHPDLRLVVVVEVS